MAVYILTGVYLILCSYTDIRHKKINVLFSVIVGLIGLVMSIFRLCGLNISFFNISSFYISSYALTLHTSVYTFLVSLFISLLIFAISFLTKGSISIGDCIMLTVLACFMPPYCILSILLYGLISSGITALFLIIIKKLSRKDTIPFAPFLFIGHICSFLL